nr:hypothetical protein [Tanacetum cinerariifolium]
MYRHGVNSHEAFLVFEIKEFNFDFEEEIHLSENLLYVNSSLRPPKEHNVEEEHIKREHADYINHKVTEFNAKNLLPISSECEVTSKDESECDVPAKDDCSPAFTTFSNSLFNGNDDLDSSDDESLPEEDVPAEEFKESDFNFEEEIHLSKNLLYDNSSSQPSEELNVDEERIKREHADYISHIEMLFTINPRPRPTVNANAIVESLPSLPIPNKVTEFNAKNLLPIPSECEVTSKDESECDVPAKDDCSPAFTTFSNPLFNGNDDLDSSDDESLPEEDVLAEEFKVYSNPLFDNDEINSDKLDPHCFNVESDFNFEEEIHLSENLLYDNSSSQPSEELNVDEERIKREHADYISHIEMLFTINPRPRPTMNANAIVESLPSLPIPRVENDDDTEGEIDVVNELRVDNSISNSEHEFSESEESNFDNPSFPRPPPEPPDAEFDFEPDAEEEIPECTVPISENFPNCDNRSDILFDSNNDDLSSDDESFKDIEYIDASVPDPAIAKETRSGNTTHANYSLPEYDSFRVEIEPDQERLINLVENDIPDNSSNDPLLEEVDLFLSDDSIPPGIENFDDDPEGDIRFLEELLIDDSILYHESFDSSFEDNPSISRPPPEPPDDNFDLEPEDYPLEIEAFLCRILSWFPKPS